MRVRLNVPGREELVVRNYTSMRPGSDDHHGPAVRAGVPVACPMARSETVCNGHSRTRQIASELQIRWSGKHDKPVPKLIVAPIPGIAAPSRRGGSQERIEYL